MRFKIGVMLESFKCSIDEAVKQALRVGVKGVQFYGVNGPLDCDTLSSRQREKLKKMFLDNNIEVSAICADLGGHGFEIASDNPKKIEKSCRVMDLARDLDCSIVTTHIGVIPRQDNKTRRALKEACERIGQYGESIDVKLAIETGPEPCEVLKAFLDDLETNHVGVNYDPANLVMVTGDDPVKGVHILRDYIFHTHAKDGIMKKRTDPKIIYGYFANGGIENINLEEYFIETSLGKGDVDFKGWINALNEIGYGGYLTIERETVYDPYNDIEKGVEFLRKLIYI